MSNVISAVRGPKFTKIITSLVKRIFHLYIAPFLLSHLTYDIVVRPLENRELWSPTLYGGKRTPNFERPFSNVAYFARVTQFR